MAYIKEDNEDSYVVAKDDGTFVKIAKTPETMGFRNLYNRETGAGTETGMPAEPAVPEAPLFNPDAFKSTVGGAIGGMGGSTQTPFMNPDGSPAVPATGGSVPASPLGSVGQGSVLAPGLEVEKETSQLGAANTPRVGSQGSMGMGGMPGFMTETTTTSGSSQKMYDPAKLAEVQSGFGKVADAQHKAGDIASSISKEEQEKLGAQATERMNREEQMQADIDSAKALSDKYNTELGVLMKDHQDTNIRPRGMFEDDNLGQNVMAGIAIAMGALGGALTGSNQNVALQIFDKAIERDLEAQKANLGKKREGISILGIQYQAARQAGMDDAAAKDKVFANAYSRISEMFDAKKAGLQGDLAKQNAEAAAAMTRTEAAKYDAEATAKTIQNQKVTQEKVDTSKMVPMANPSETERKEIRANAEVINEIRNMRKFVTESKVDPGILGGASLMAREKLNMINKDEAAFLANTKRFGEVIKNKLTGTGGSQVQYANMEKFLPSAWDSNEQIMAKLEELERQSTMAYQDIADGYGLKPGMKTKDGWMVPDIESVEARNKRLGAK